MGTEDRRWDELHDAGARAHPSVALDRREFAASAESMQNRSQSRTGLAATEWPGTAHAADVFLAIACDLGAPGAWEEFEREFLPRLHRFLRSSDASESEAETVITDLPGMLCHPPADQRARTRLGTYDGSAALFTWLAVVARRRVQELRRDASKNAVDSASDIAAPRSPPAQGVVGTEMAHRFQLALAAAWRTLTPKERLAVLLRHRDGLSGNDIARVLDVGAPRVSRLIESGVRRLHEAVRRQMPETPPGASTPDQVIWIALGEVLARHMANIDDPPHVQDTGG